MIKESSTLFFSLQIKFVYAVTHFVKLLLDWLSACMCNKCTSVQEPCDLYHPNMTWTFKMNSNRSNLQINVIYTTRAVTLVWISYYFFSLNITIIFSYLHTYLMRIWFSIANTLYYGAEQMQNKVESVDGKV